MDRSAPAKPAQALIQRIEEEVQKELEKILDAATDEAAAKVKAAHAKARRRVHLEIESLRRGRDEALRHEEARLDTLRRQLRQREAGTVIAAGLPILRRALVALWSDSVTRQGWVENVIAAAARRLRPGLWTVEYPVGWAEEERAAAARKIEEACGQAPEFRLNADLEAGLALVAENVRLDASLDALTRHPEATGAALLAVLQAHAEKPQ